MALKAAESPTPRAPLTRERVLRAAIELADSAGIESLTMRRLAQELGVEAMTLYYYVANKAELIGAMVAMVMDEIELPTPEDEWKPALRRTAISAHEVLMRHPWASAGMMTGGLTPERLRYMEAILGCLRGGGFSSWETHLAYHALESHTVGFTLWLAGMNLPEDSTGLVESVLREVPAEEYPAFVEHVHEHLKEREPDDEGSFVFGLDLILDGLERLRDRD